MTTTNPMGLRSRAGLPYLAVLVLTVLAVAPARATVLFAESFDTDTGDALVTYPAFSLSQGTTPVTVSGGVLQMLPQGAGLLQRFDVAGFAGNLLISADLTSSPGGGGMNVGIAVGANTMSFHPGLAGGVFPAGSFRVGGPGGFGNTDMGFTPTAGALNHIEILVWEATGLFEISVTDATNPANVFQTSFTNAGYSAGDRIGFTVEGFANTGVGSFDNLVVSRVPEPATALLVLAGLVSAAGARRLRGG